jgi:hypothetical protein
MRCPRRSATGGSELVGARVAVGASSLAQSAASCATRHLGGDPVAGGALEAARERVPSRRGAGSRPTCAPSATSPSRSRSPRASPRCAPSCRRRRQPCPAARARRSARRAGGAPPRSPHTPWHRPPLAPRRRGRRAPPRARAPAQRRPQRSPCGRGDRGPGSWSCPREWRRASDRGATPRGGTRSSRRSRLGSSSVFARTRSASVSA